MWFLNSPRISEVFRRGSALEGLATAKEAEQKALNQRCLNATGFPSALIFSSSTFKHGEIHLIVNDLVPVITKEISMMSGIDEIPPPRNRAKLHLHREKSKIFFEFKVDLQSLFCSWLTIE